MPIPLPRRLSGLLLATLLAASGGAALADPSRPHSHPGFQRPDGAGGRMSWEDRQRLREDLRRNNDAGAREERREARRERFERMTPEERQKLREDLRNFDGRR